VKSKTAIFLTLVLFAAVFAAAAAFASYRPNANVALKFVPGELIVKFKPRMIVLPKGVTTATISQLRETPQSIEDISGRYGVLKIEKIFKNAKEETIYSSKTSGLISDGGLSTYYKITFPKETDINAAASELRADPAVLIAEPNYLRRTAVPDDPQYIDHSQWGLYKINLNPFGSPESGWNESTGSTEVIIAIIDTGVDWNHPDLAANIWLNSFEAAGTPGVDDDANGFVDDIRGWDFVSVDPSEVAPGEDPGPPDNNPMDFDGHGTHVSGIASAVTNNSAGVAGTGWDCRIMALRAGFQSPDGWAYLSDSDSAAAIVYAADNGADVMNMSWGDSAPSSIISESIAHATIEGCLPVAAAGNSDVSIPFYPAAVPDVLAVGATDKNDMRSIWAYRAASNYGSWVDVYAAR